MKWNWGTKLFIFTALFMIFMVILAVLSFRQDLHLVENDYYPKALEFQKKIDKMNNAKGLENAVIVRKEGDFVSVSFPENFDPDSVSGKIVFYRPADEGDDFQVDIELDSLCRQFYPVSGLKKGKYIVKLDFLIGQVPYYQEKTIFVKMD